MQILNWTRQALAILGIATLAAAAVICLPDNEYQRYSLLDHTIHGRIRWIYERIHYDNKPIDIAIIGSSRVRLGINAAYLESLFAASNNSLNAVNFSLAVDGSDIHWLIMKQLLLTKQPRLIIIGITEIPSRSGHNAFKYVAPVSDIVNPRYLVNINYLPNLVYLPFRQIQLFAALLAPSVFDFPDNFNRASYKLSSKQEIQILPFKSKPNYYFNDGEKQHLLKKAKIFEEGQPVPLLGSKLASFEFGGEYEYISRMSALAKLHNIPIAFIYVPYFNSTNQILNKNFYLKYGPIFDASFISRCYNLYSKSDVRHLNSEGSRVLSTWLAPKIISLLKLTQSKSVPVALAQTCQKA